MEAYGKLLAIITKTRYISRDSAPLTVANYSQTGCSFPRDFANFRRDVGILIGSLLGTICMCRDQIATELIEIA